MLFTVFDWSTQKNSFPQSRKQHSAYDLGQFLRLQENTSPVQTSHLQWWEAVAAIEQPITLIRIIKCGPVFFFRPWWRRA